jgi:archaellin
VSVASVVRVVVAMVAVAAMVVAHVAVAVGVKNASRASSTSRRWSSPA